MKTNKKIHSIALVSMALILFLILVSCTASASVTETKITNNGMASQPAIYANKIAWTEKQNGTDKTNICLFDLSTKKKTQITTSGLASSPKIYDNKIVWQDARSGGSNIYMYDFYTKKETKITNSGWAYSPSIYGNIIVWNDNRNYDHYSIDPIYDVYMYDISTKKETEVAKQHVSCAIYGNKIAMLESVGDGPIDLNNIYLYDISTKKATQITTNGYNERPVIYNNKIVWDHWIKEDYSNIYMYDLSTKKETQITKSSSHSVNPVIFGNNIVWQDNRNGDWDIYAYDLITHQEIHTLDKADHEAPAIYGNNIVWQDPVIGNIYLGTLSYLPVAAFTASPTSGKHPLIVQFTDKSTDAYYWSWNFGDKITSTLQSPTHKYTKAGKYTVTLKVRNAAGSNTKTMSISVK